MTPLIVYYLNGQWYGEEVSYKRSGSGFYQEISRISGHSVSNVGVLIHTGLKAIRGQIARVPS